MYRRRPFFVWVKGVQGVKEENEVQGSGKNHPLALLFCIRFPNRFHGNFMVRHHETVVLHFDGRF